MMNNTGKTIALIKALGGGGGGGSGSDLVFPVFTEEFDETTGPNIVCDMTADEILDAFLNKKCFGGFFFSGSQSLFVSPTFMYIDVAFEGLVSFSMFQTFQQPMSINFMYQKDYQTGEYYIYPFAVSLMILSNPAVIKNNTSRISMEPLPNYYNVGERSTLQFSLLPPYDPMAQYPASQTAYKLIFKCPDNAVTSITFPQDVIATAGYNLQPGKTYIMDLIGNGSPGNDAGVIAYFKEYEVVSI